MIMSNTNFSDFNYSYLETQQKADIPWRILVDKVRQAKNLSFLLGLLLNIRLRKL